MTAPAEHKSVPDAVVRATGLRRDGRLNDAAAVLEAALRADRAKPFDVPFGDRVQLGLALADLYVETGRHESARNLLLAEAVFADQVGVLIRQTGSPEQMCAASVGAYQLRGRAAQLALVGHAAPEIEVADWVLGQPTTLAEQLGHVVLLEFWAHWCRPCLTSFPVLRELHDRYAGGGLTVIALTRFVLRPGGDPVADRARQRDAICRTIWGRGLDFAVGIAPDGQLQHKYGVLGIPAVALVDRTGIVRSASPGGDRARLERGIVALLNAPS